MNVFVPLSDLRVDVGPMDGAQTVCTPVSRMTGTEASDVAAASDRGILVAGQIEENFKGMEEATVLDRGKARDLTMNGRSR